MEITIINDKRGQEKLGKNKRKTRKEAVCLVSYSAQLHIMIESKKLEPNFGVPILFFHVGFLYFTL